MKDSMNNKIRVGDFVEFDLEKTCGKIDHFYTFQGKAYALIRDFELGGYDRQICKIRKLTDNEAMIYILENS